MPMLRIRTAGNDFKCLPQRGVRITEVSAERESAVILSKKWLKKEKQAYSTSFQRGDKIYIA